FGARRPDVIRAQIDSWLNRDDLPTLDEMDVLVVVLRRSLRNGPGVGTRINYDPHKTTASGLSRPPHVALFHELLHAHYNAMGGQPGAEESTDEGRGGRLFELIAVGMPPFDNYTFSENRFRAALGVPARPYYP